MPNQYAQALANTLDGTFCLAALREALVGAGRAPEIFNTDQGSQFTSRTWIETARQCGGKVSMDGKGRWMDNVFIERLWRSVKHGGVYLWAHENVHQLEAVLEKWFNEYNHWKPPSSAWLRDTVGMLPARPSRMEKRGKKANDPVYWFSVNWKKLGWQLMSGCCCFGCV